MNMDMDSHFSGKRNRRVKLVFNPASGASNKSPDQLMNIINELQVWKLIPEVFLTEPDSDFKAMAEDALSRGMTMLVVCGGDGTISAVAKELTGKRCTLGIIPTGTRNNIALGLNIPSQLSDAIAILRTGRRVKTDMGLLTFKDSKIPFLEVCSVGLMSSLFSSGDSVQHMHLEKIGNFVSTFVSIPPSKITMTLENASEINTIGHMAIVSNMPYVGCHYQVGSIDAFKDGRLDVMLFSNLNKLDLLKCVMKKSDVSISDDSRIQHFRVHSVDINTSPVMSVMADGAVLGEGPVHIEVQRRALAVMTANITRKSVPESKKVTEKKSQ